jgi:glucose-1-phosphate adenylyltransferase
MEFKGKIMAFVLAGGKGERLRPLTESRTKAAVPFGGMCRLIDFALSNLVNSGIRDIIVVAQDRADSLLRHLERSWMSPTAIRGAFIKPVTPWNSGCDGYLGTANAVYRNLDLIERGKPDLVLVFGSDHVYTMDVRPMIQSHLERRAEITVATLPLPVGQSGPFGTVGIDEGWRVREFREKSPQPATLPGRSDLALVSMGNYIFDPRVLVEALAEDAATDGSRHDFGRDIFPKACRTRRIYAYDFRKNAIPGTERPSDYWRDVGSIESYYRANMELNRPGSHLSLYLPDWPIRSIKLNGLPPKVTSDPSGKSGFIENSILGSSSIISGAYVRNSVIGPNVRIASRAVVEESVILGDVVVEEGAKIRRAIIDHGNVIRETQRIGYDQDEDDARFHLDPSGIVVIPHAGLAVRSEPDLRPRRLPWESFARFAGAGT